MPELSRIDPGSAALLVMDYQVDALTKFMTAAQSADAIACVPDLIAAARDAGMMVIHVVVAFRPGHPEVSPRNPVFSAVKANGMLGPGAKAPRSTRPQRHERENRSWSSTASQLVVDGLVMRYQTSTEVDGLPPGEGVFLPCSFWLADSYTLQNRDSEARALFERLLSLRNDVGLLAEEYDPRARRLVGNFPQAFSHVALIGTALNLHKVGPAQRRDPETPPVSTSTRSVPREWVAE
jgi:hypothetical protein